MNFVLKSESTFLLIPFLPYLQCPATSSGLTLQGDRLFADDGRAYPVEDGVPRFTEVCGDDARRQRDHYDGVAAAYIANLSYPHTQEYAAYLDGAFIDALGSGRLGTVAEICCGSGEALRLLGGRVERGIGVDISMEMLRRARGLTSGGRRLFVQGDATRLPLASGMFDCVVILGGIHHVPDRAALFREVQRILKPGGVFVFREPVSDAWLWRALRAIVYRLSPALDARTERPLRHRETVPVLMSAGLELVSWTTHGLLGFCVLMNSDILHFNRYFRFVPGIRSIARAMARLDAGVLAAPGLGKLGLQVVGKAIKRS
jgi:SAM-dependent methyltransferase